MHCEGAGLSLLQRFLLWLHICTYTFSPEPLGRIFQGLVLLQIVWQAHLLTIYHALQDLCKVCSCCLTIWLFCTDFLNPQEMEKAWMGGRQDAPAKPLSKITSQSSAVPPLKERKSGKSAANRNRPAVDPSAGVMLLH